MKASKVLISTILIILLLVVYSASMKFIKNEDFIGSYYSVNIKQNIAIEICGTATRIIDHKDDETIISNIDSMIVVDDAIYGISKERYFLLALSNRKVVYCSNPMEQYSKYNLSSPMEFYREKTRYIDIIGRIILVGCIFFIIKIGFFNASKKTKVVER